MTRAARRGWMVKIAFVTLGLAGVGYAADQVVAPPEPDMNATIRAQKIAEGQLVGPNAKGPSEHQLEAFSPEQMRQLSAKYDLEMKTAIEHAENVRIVAYRTRDIIRITCIDDKLAQMKAVLKLAEPRLASVQRTEEELRLRQDFLLVHQAQQRIGELATEVDVCMGDNLDAVSLARIGEETPGGENVFDHTRPPAPSQDIERPGEASPYR